MKARLCPLLALLAVAVAAPPATAHAGPSSAEELMVRQVNKIRKAHELRPLRRSRSLTRSARSFGRYMLRTDSFAHASAIRASRRFGYLGEVLARSPTVPRATSVVSAWMNSPSHRAVLMNRRYRYVGIGRVHGSTLGSVVVGHFGAR